MLALLTAHNRPQTILLTALFLVMTAALLACGPVTQPVPAEGSALPAAQQEGSDNAGESGDDIWMPPPKPTETYPQIWNSQLQSAVVEFEQAEAAASGPSGQSDAAPEDAAVLVQIFLSGNKAEVAAWLRSKGVSPLYAEEADYPHLAAEVPLSVLGELSQQDGVRKIEEPLRGVTMD